MQGKVILITGATGGIAQAVIPLLAEQGADLVLAARRGEVLSQIAAQVQGPGQVLTVPTDVTQPDQVERLVEKAQSQCGRIDGVLNCAGLGVLKPAPQITTEDLDRMLAVNLKGSFYVSQQVANLMREQRSGHILNFPGILGRHPMAMAAGYCASKFAVVGFTKCMADELKRFGVKFTLFYFGGVDSPFWDDIAMKVQRDKMLRLETVAETIRHTLSLPADAVPGEVVLQPESHQFF